MYCYRGNRSTNCVDCYQVKESENLYECFQCNKCQNGKYLYNCNNTHTSAFLRACTGCANCLLCSNLVNANYYIGNKQYPKEEYQKKVDEITSDPKKFTALKEEFFRVVNGPIICKDLDNMNSELCVGNELIDCNRCYDCYMMKGCEDSRHAWDNVNYKTSMDNYSGG